MLWKEKLEKDGLFASKELYDYLSSNEIKAITKGGRISLSKNFNLAQLIGIRKAVGNYLSNTNLSTVRGIRKEKSKVDKEAGKSIPYNIISAMYTAKELYKWADDVFGSEFWKDYVPKVSSYTKLDWVSYCLCHPELITQINDETIITRLKLLYDLLKG